MELGLKCCPIRHQIEIGDMNLWVVSLEDRSSERRLQCVLDMKHLIIQREVQIWDWFFSETQTFSFISHRQLSTFLTSLANQEMPRIRNNKSKDSIKNNHWVIANMYTHFFFFTHILLLLLFLGLLYCLSIFNRTAESTFLFYCTCKLPAFALWYWVIYTTSIILNTELDALHRI